jgi:hypothetical protein
MRKLGLALFLLLGIAPAQAQPVTNPVNGVAAAYNSAAPTCTSGVFCWLQVDANGNLKITGTVTATSTNPVGVTPTDRTITSASGASQQIMAANASRHSLTIVNNGNANCGVNPTGGTAAISGAGTLTLGPLGAYTPRIPTLSAVTVICTAGQPIYGDEN